MNTIMNTSMNTSMNRIMNTGMNRIVNGAVNDIVNEIMNGIVNVGALIDTLKAVFHGFGDLLQAMHTILRLIGSLAGG